MASNIDLYFSGSLAPNQSIDLRLLSHALNHLQASLNKATMKVKYGEVLKNKHITVEARELFNLEFESTHQNSFRIIFKAINDFTEEVIADFANHISPTYDQAKTGVDIIESLNNSLENIRLSIYNNIAIPVDFEEHDFSLEATNSYATRTVNREVNQLVSPVRTSSGDSDSIILTTRTQRTNVFEFDKSIATNYGKIVSGKNLGTPMNLKGRIMSMIGSNKPSAVIKNLVNESRSKLKFFKFDDFLRFKTRYDIFDDCMIVVCPILEYKSFEPATGDFAFVGFVD